MQHSYRIPARRGRRLAPGLWYSDLYHFMPLALKADVSAHPRKAREAWLQSVDLEDRDERLFELETRLKALDRFFNVDNLPINTNESLISRDFSIEIRAASAACREVSRIARYLLREEASAFTFRSYIENKMLADRARDTFNAKHVAQESPAESLYLLGAAFQNFADMGHAFTRLNTVSYPLFVGFGQMVSREIAANRFFNPMADDQFHPSQDKMRNQVVAQVVRNVSDKEIKKELSIALLAFFRLMRYLEYIDTESEKRDELRNSLLIFALIHSESRALIHFLEKEIPQRLAKVRGRKRTVAFVEVADSLAFQFGMEIRKVYQQILRDLLGSGSLARLRSAVSSAAGILRNFYEQSIVLIVQTFETGVQGRQIFPGFVSKVEQSVRLREDIWVLNKLCDYVEQKLAGETLTAPEFQAAITPLSEFIDYFMGLSFKFVRYSDHDEMERFFILVKSSNAALAENSLKLADFRKKVGYFNRFVETTLGHIRHRQELQDVPLDSDHARRLLDQYLA